MMKHRRRRAVGAGLATAVGLVLAFCLWAGPAVALAQDSPDEADMTGLSAVERSFATREVSGRRFNLRQFGYDIFTAGAFLEQLQQLPVPSGYYVGPGDELRIRLTGRVEAEHRVTVDREGHVVIPNVGAVSVAGLTFQELQQIIQDEFAHLYTDVRVHVTLERLRSLQVYVLGEVERPGVHSVRNLDTIMHALVAAGGVKRSGSLRNIRLLRNDQVVHVFDVYDFLLAGVRAGDIRLQDGDVVHVPPIGDVVGIAGEVVRPGIYELKEGQTLRELIQLASGVTPSAYVGSIRIDRYQDHVRRTLVEESFQGVGELLSGQREVALHDGDLVYVPDLSVDRLPVRGGEVVLQGNVRRPGSYPLVEGMTVGQLLRRGEGILGETYTQRGEILRFVSPQTREVKAFDVQRALDGDPEHDLPLEEWDIVHVYAVYDVLPEPWVEVSGEVHEPGRIRWVEGMRVRDALFKAREVTDQAYLGRADLFRLRTDELREVITIDLQRLLEGDASANVLLQPRDHLVVYSVEQALRRREVTVAGHVRTPGTYELEKDMRLSDLIFRAGGFTPEADVERIEIYRPNYATGGPVEIIAVAVSNREATARSAANGSGFPKVRLEADPLLQEGDQVFVRARKDHVEERSVTVAGEVVYPGIYRLTPGERLHSVIQRAGGFTPQAYPYGIVFTRSSLRQRQQAFIEDFVRSEAERIQRERAALDQLPLTTEEKERRWRSLEHRSQLLELMKSRSAQGRIILELESAEIAGTPYDLLLQDGDHIQVPTLPETVLVVGAVYMPEALVHIPGQTVDFYLQQVGGLRPEAAADEMYVIKANGRVETAATGFSPLRQGDTIVVPYRWDPLFAAGELNPAVEEVDR